MAGRIFSRCAAALAFASILALPGAPAKAAASFSAIADAQLVRVVLGTTPATLSEELLDPGAIASQATLTSLGESTAWSSNPYLGSLLTTAPGLVTYVLQSQFPDVPLPAAPAYPFYVASSHPLTPSATLEVGTTSLRATSVETQSEGLTRDGANRGASHVGVDPSSETVTARATTELASVEAGPQVAIGGLRSSAEVTRTSSGDLERSSSFEIATLTVLGQALRLTPDGLELATVNLPTGSGGLSAVDALLQQLSTEGVDLELLPAQETANGVISAGLQLTIRVPNPAAPGGTVNARLTYGRTLAQVTNEARPTRPAPVSPNLPTTEPGASGVGAGSGFNPSAPSTALPSSPPVADSPTQAVAAGLTRGLVPDETDVGRFYPVLVVVAGLVAASFTMFRKAVGGVAWSS